MCAGRSSAHGSSNGEVIPTMSGLSWGGASLPGYRQINCGSGLSAFVVATPVTGNATFLKTEKAVTLGAAA